MVYNKLSIFLTLLLLIFLVHSPITGYSATGSGSIEGIVCDLAGQPLSDIAILAIIDQNPYSNIFYQISFNTASFYPFFRDDISIYNDGLFESFSQPSASLCDFYKLTYYDILCPKYPNYATFNPTEYNIWDNYYKTSTNANGKFILSDLPKRTYILWAIDLSPRGYISSLYHTDEFKKIIINEGETISSINFSLDIGGTLISKAIDNTTDEPLSGIFFEARYNSAAYSPIYSTSISDINGNIIFKGLPPGNYFIQPIVLNNYIPQKSTDEYQPIYEVKKAETTIANDCLFKHGGVITGHIFNEKTTEPVVNVPIEAFGTKHYMPNSYGLAFSQEDGSYRIEGLGENEYIIIARRDAIVSTSQNDQANKFQTVYYSDTQEYNKATIIPIQNGNLIEDINFYLTLGATITGKIIDGQTGQPLSNIQVNIKKDSKSPIIFSPYSDYNIYDLFSNINPVITLEDGVFIFHGIAEDTYRIYASDTGDLFYQNFSDSDLNNNGILGNIDQIKAYNIGDIPMYAWGCIEGRIINSDGEGVAGVVIMAMTANYIESQDQSILDYDISYDEYYNVGMVLSKKNGNFSICKLEAKDYLLKVVGANELGYLNSYIEDQNQQGRPMVINIAPAETKEEIKCVLKKGGKIFGKITDSLGNSIPFIKIEWQNINYDKSKDNKKGLDINPKSGSVQTDADGLYSITSLIDGDYNLKTNIQYTNTGSISNIQKIFLNNVYDNPITLSQENNIIEADIILQKGGIISGQILDFETMSPCQGLTVVAQLLRLADMDSDDTIIRNNDSTFYSLPINTQYRSDSSNINGEYRIYGLPSGDYHIYISNIKNKYIFSAYNQNEGIFIQYYKDKFSIENATEVSIISPGEIKYGIDFKYQKGGTIKLKFYDNQTNSLIGSYFGEVQLQTEDKKLFKSILFSFDTNQIYPPYFNTSEFILEGVPVGKYYIYVIEHRNNFESTYYKEMGDDNTLIEIQSRNTILDLDIHLKKKGSISGRVICDVYNVPIPNVLINSIRTFNLGETPSGLLTSTVMTDENGFYSLDGFNEGEYVLYTHDLNHTYASLFYRDIPLEFNDPGNIGALLNNIPDGVEIIDLAPSEQKTNINFYLPVSFDYKDAIYIQQNIEFTPSPESLSMSPIVYYPPEIISIPDKTVILGNTYTYQVIATDRDPGDILNYHLSRKPDGMTIGTNTGLIKWKAKKPQYEAEIVKVEVYDIRNMRSSQAYTLYVIDDTKPPEDVSNLKAQEDNISITLTWTPSINSDDDLANQLLYIDQGNGFIDAISLGKDSTSYILPQSIYNDTQQIKITVIDSLNNESEGIVVDVMPVTPLQDISPILQSVPVPPATTFPTFNNSWSANINQWQSSPISSMGFNFPNQSIWQWQPITATPQLSIPWLNTSSSFDKNFRSIE